MFFRSVFRILESKVEPPHGNTRCYQTFTMVYDDYSSTQSRIRSAISRRGVEMGWTQTMEIVLIGPSTQTLAHLGPIRIHRLYRVVDATLVRILVEQSCHLRLQRILHWTN